MTDKDFEVLGVKHAETMKQIEIEKGKLYAKIQMELINKKFSEIYLKYFPKTL